MSEEFKNDSNESVTENTEAGERPARPAYKREFKPAGASSSPRDYKDRGAGGGGKRNSYSANSRAPKKKVCRFCAEIIAVDYLNVRILRSFITERAKIVPARISGTCAVHQRQLTEAIKRARSLALVPYTSAH